MTTFADQDVQRAEDTPLHRNKMKVTSPDSDKTYTIAQRTTDLVWCCSCWAWRTSQPNPCKHLRALGLVNGTDEPAQVVLDRIGELRWVVQQARAKVDGPPRKSSRKQAAVTRRSTPVQDVVDVQTEAILSRNRISRQPSSTAQHNHATRASRNACVQCRHNDRQSAQNRPVTRSTPAAGKSTSSPGNSRLAQSSAQSSRIPDLGRALTLSVVEDAAFDLIRERCQQHDINTGELALILFRLTGRLRGAP